MISIIKPNIIFHLIEDIHMKPRNFSCELEFCGHKKINFHERPIGEKNFSKTKDKFKTKITLFIENKIYKSVISLYYGENHLTILRSARVGTTYEIINFFPKNSQMKPIDKIDFFIENNQKISAKYFDTIGNDYKRRFLLVNFPIYIKLNFIGIKKMKENLSYKIDMFENDIIIHENKESPSKEKIKLNDFNKMTTISKEIENFIKNERTKVNFDQMKKIIEELQPYDNYFNQNLMNKEDNNWRSEEFNFYYYYFQFKLYLMYVTNKDSTKITYYQAANQIFKNTFKELEKMKNVTFFQKICAIVSLYIRFKTDCENKENKSHLIGQYKLINIDDNKIKCYNLVYEFISKIINNLKENSLIYLPLLQVNSGFSRDINSEDKNDIFELSMLNANMIKRHLKLLMPKLFFVIRHPTIHSKRGSICKATGFLFIYESSIFKNLIGMDIDDIINKYPEDAAVMVSFVILHEIFMHKKIRSNDDYEEGKETPPKFIGPKYEIKNFYYSSNNKNLDPLNIYNKDKENENKISEEGESGKMLEYFFENKNFEIMTYLKKYLGLGELLNRVDLIVDENFDRLHCYIAKKIEEGIAKPLLKEKFKKNNYKNIDSEEKDQDKIKAKMELEEENEEEEEEESDEELSEETKRLMKLVTD